MQPPEPPPPASMGVEEMGSASGALETVKSEAKESIGVYVCGLKDVNLSEDERLIRTHLYTVEVWAEGRAGTLYVADEGHV